MRPWIQAYPSYVPPTFEPPSELLPDRLRHNALKFPRRKACVFFGRAISYAALDRAVDRFAAALQDCGIERGDRVALYLPNSPQYVIGFYGVLRAGAIAVPCNPLYVARELEHQLVDSGAKVALTFGPFFQTLESIRARTALERVVVARLKDFFPFPLKLAFTLFQEKRLGHRVSIAGHSNTVSFENFLKKAPRAPRPVELMPGDTACLLYTGGTTGVPKGAQLSQANLLINAHQCHLWFNTRIGAEVVPCALPFSHSYGLTTCLNYGIYAAATLLLIPDPRDLKRLLRALEKERATFLPGVPTLFRALGNHPDVGKFNLTSIRACISGGAPLTCEIKERFEALTGGCVVEGYGLTEASPVTHANPVGPSGKLGTIGLPWPNVDCKIVDLESGKPVAEDGQIGELWVRGPQVMRGYWNQPEESSNVLQDGWLRTGDLVSRDAQGFHTLHARKKDLIIAGGYKIFPGEVEDVVQRHPRVEEVAAVGVPHPYRGETVRLFVVPKKNQALSESEIITWCREHLAKYKIPTSVEFREWLPKNAQGKILRQQLRADDGQRMRQGQV